MYLAVVFDFDWKWRDFFDFVASLFGFRAIESEAFLDLISKQL